MLSSVLVAILGCSSALASAVNGAEPAPAVSCTSYQPVGWSSAKAKIQYYNNNPNNNPVNGAGFQAPTLPNNATISPGQRFKLAPKHLAGGYSFTFAACNVSSVGLVTNTTQSSCSHTGCYITYTIYVQVHDTLNRCLTVSKYNVSTSGLSFQSCQANPQDKAQYFQVTQQVLYSAGAGYSEIQSYGSVQFDLPQNFGHEDPSLGGFARAWALSRADNRTVESVHADYTQIGLSANLLPA